jgi:hypothetical protein
MTEKPSSAANTVIFMAESEVSLFIFVAKPVFV